MKKLLTTSLFFIAMVSALTIHSTYARPNPSNCPIMKFGVQLGGGVFLTAFAQGYFEYQLKENLGIQTGLKLHHSSYLLQLKEKTAQEGKKNLYHPIDTKYVMLPILARWYPGKDRQFCLFGGIQLGYLIGADLYTKTINSPASFLDAKPDELQDTLNKVHEIFKNGSKKVLSEITETNKLNLAMVYGFDYEFGFGLNLGIINSKVLTPIAKNTKDLNQIDVSVKIGYNIAKLLLKQ
jgi:hypothetical protein